MQQATKDNLANRNIWARGLYILFYLIAYAVAEAIVTLVVFFQFIHALFTGRVNEPLQIFGARLSTYIYQILQYTTFNSEFQPFPFSDWPDTAGGDTPWSAASETESEPAATEDQVEASESSESSETSEVSEGDDRDDVDEADESEESREK